MTGFIITPEKVADHLERLVGDPAELREQLERGERIAMDLLRRDRLEAWGIISTGEIVEPADAAV